MKKDKVLVIFKSDFTDKNDSWWNQFDVVVAPIELKSVVEKKGLGFADINNLIEVGSIYEASALVEELSLLKLPDGSRITKLFLYKGYELWWMYYNSLFIYFCLPYTQYKKLLEYLKDFKKIYLYNPPYKSLFSSFFEVHENEVNIIRESGIKSPSFLPFGILLQIILNIIFIPILVVFRRHFMLFTGDKFDKGKDYDFRMKFVYEEARERNIPFVEFIRSLESWKTILSHAFTRKRPVVYSEGITFMGRFLSFVSGGGGRARKKFNIDSIYTGTDLDKKLKFSFASQYLFSVYDDVWSIRITKFVLKIIGIKSAFIAAATERNFHSVLACKLNRITTIGILHGVASKHYNVYDFLHSFDGEKTLSVDKYGLWSEWWKEYYLKNSKAYKPNQLYMSGPMRPLVGDNKARKEKVENKNGPIKVLFVPGELSDPNEIIPYIDSLMNKKNILFFLTFRPSRDRFEGWLKDNNPSLIERIGRKNILLGNIHDVISKCDVVVGSYSTAALEAVLQNKPVVFFDTRKWGDYFDLRNYDAQRFFAENPQELTEKVLRSQMISSKVIGDMRDRFFGDPYKNGSKWVIDEVEKFLN